MRCFAILMAAGFSSRFGKKNKLLEPFMGNPLAAHALDLVCGMQCFDGVFFVYSDEKTAAVAKNYPVTAVYNPSPQKGQGESVRLGVLASDSFATAAEQEPAYYFFLPCDQPLLDAATVQLLLNAARPGCIVQAGFSGGKGGSPSLFSAVFHDELLALKPGQPANLIKSRYPELVITVEAADPFLLADIDTPDDLHSLEQYAEKNSRKN